MTAALRRLFLSDLVAATPRSGVVPVRPLRTTSGRFAYGADALATVNGRLYRHFCSSSVGCGGIVGSDRRTQSPLTALEALTTPPADAARFRALNGGSDPIVVMASHLLDRAGRGGASDGLCRSGAGGGGGSGGIGGGGSGGSGGSLGSTGRAAAGGVMLRLRVYNATNARLPGLRLELTLGGGAEMMAPRVGQWGRAVLDVRETLLPGREISWDVRLATRQHLPDLTMNALVSFPHPEPEADLEGDGEPTVGDAAVGGGGGGAGGVGAGGGGGGLGATAGASKRGGMDSTNALDGCDGCSGSRGGAVVAVGCYTIPAEAFLCPPRAGAPAWPAFLALWGALPCRFCLGLRAAPHLAAFVPTAADAYALLSAFELGARDPRAAGRVWPPSLPGQRLLCAAWLFESWQGATVAVVLFAARVDGPSSNGGLSGFGGGGVGGGLRGAAMVPGGGGGTWAGRFEVRSDAARCLEGARDLSARLMTFVTNNLFEEMSTADGGSGGRDPFDAVGAHASPAARGSAGALEAWRALKGLRPPGGIREAPATPEIFA
ncbi:unnamed protein product [Phaeothamnion confervicola]